jgi:hypothetical protein
MIEKVFTEKKQWLFKNYIDTISKGEITVLEINTSGFLVLNDVKYVLGISVDVSYNFPTDDFNSEKELNFYLKKKYADDAGLFLKMAGVDFTGNVGFRVRKFN